MNCEWGRGRGEGCVLSLLACGCGLLVDTMPYRTIWPLKGCRRLWQRLDGRQTWWVAAVISGCGLWPVSYRRTQVIPSIMDYWRRSGPPSFGYKERLVCCECVASMFSMGRKRLFKMSSQIINPSPPLSPGSFRPLGHGFGEQGCRAVQGGERGRLYCPDPLSRWLDTTPTREVSADAS